MAYRFNPPPNWSIDDPAWTPPPGWHPDPSWGPAPEGWNYWIQVDSPAVPDAQDAAAAPESEAVAEPEPEPDAVAVPEPEPEPTAEPAAEPEPTAEPAAEAEPEPAAAPEPATEAAPDAVEPDIDDATRLVPLPESADAAEPAPQPMPADDDATRITPSAQQPPGTEEPSGPETAEYPGPDLEAGLAQQAPYETAPPVEPGPQEPPQDPAAAHGHGHAAPEHVPATPVPGHGQPSPAYSQPSPAYSQPSPAYPAPPGQGSPAPAWGSASGWTATTAPSDAPRKGIVARFWWVGCIVLFLGFVLIVALIGGIILLSSGQDEAAGTDPAVTSAQEEATEEETEEATPTEEAVTEEDEEEVVTPTNLATVDPAASPVEIVTDEGTGTMTVSMEWLPASELPSTYGGTVDEAPEGEYLVVTAQMAVDAGSMTFRSGHFEVLTPFGGTLSVDGETYALDGSGLEHDAPDTFTAGEEYTLRLLFAPTRAGGMELLYDNLTDVYSWDIPA